MIWCHYVAVLPPANRCIADCGFEYRYICPFRGTRERAVILDSLIQIFESNTQIRLKNQISQRPVITIRRSRVSQSISDVLRDVRRTDPWSHGVYVPGCTFYRDAKFVPISTYHCSFQNKWTLEVVKLDAFYSFSHKCTFSIKKPTFLSITWRISCYNLTLLICWEIWKLMLLNVSITHIQLHIYRLSWMVGLFCSSWRRTWQVRSYGSNLV